MQLQYNICFRYFTNLDEVDWTSLESLQAEGTEPADGFEAIKLAASFPFSPTSHKMIALLMTKEQVHFSYLKGIRKVSQKVLPLHNDFMTLLCNYL